MYDRRKIEPILQRVKGYMDENDMIEKGDGVVIGLSGGADSVCLFRILLFLKEIYNLNLVVVHVHHMLRDKEADRDMEFVRGLSERNGVECVVVKEDVKGVSVRNKMSEEEAGRAVRYEVFERVRREKGLRKIAVAHNANDCAETMVFHLCRGTGLKGLTGISPVRGKVIRPLLGLARNEIEEFLGRCSQEYCNDSTNFETMYSRNRIRHCVLPALEKEINGNAVAHIGAAAGMLREVEGFLEDVTKGIYDGLVVRRQGCIRIRIEELLGQNVVIQKRIVRNMMEEMAGQLRDIQMVHIDGVLSLCEAQSGKRVSLPYEMEGEREYDYLVIWMLDEMGAGDFGRSAVSIVGEEGTALFEEEGFKIVYNVRKREKKLEIPKNNCTKWFDYDKIKDIVLIRGPLDGDYIQIDKDGHCKKLSRYFIDEKIPRQERKGMLVLADQNHVLWVIGKNRVSEYYKITGETKTILECTFTDF